jgi:cellulose synthase/poly-beta-1,6-N-acetylglucosamine synthase-like glycosyltransferase
MLWTLPVISVASALPFNVAGVGLREGAVMALFGLYGVSPADAVAASLLTLVARLFWAALGGMLLWREQRWQSRQRPPPRSLSIIIPVIADPNVLKETIHRWRAMPEVCEILIVDRENKEGRCELAVQFGCRSLPDAAGWAGQMLLGAAHATGDVIVLLPAGVWLPPEAGRAILSCLRDSGVVGGGFGSAFSLKNPRQLGSQFRYIVRLFWGRCMGDDRLAFVRRETMLAAGGVLDQPLRAGHELCRRLRKLGRLALADGVVRERY